MSEEQLFGRSVLGTLAYCTYFILNLSESVLSILLLLYLYCLIMKPFLVESEPRSK